MCGRYTDTEGSPVSQNRHGRSPAAPTPTLGPWLMAPYASPGAGKDRGSPAPGRRSTPAGPGVPPGGTGPAATAPARAAPIAIRPEVTASPGTACSARSTAVGPVETALAARAWAGP